MTMRRKKSPPPAHPRLPVILAIAGAGVGFLVGYLLPMLVVNLAGVRAETGDMAACCMVPLLTIAGGVGGFFYGRDLDRKGR